MIRRSYAGPLLLITMLSTVTDSFFSDIIVAADAANSWELVWSDEFEQDGAPDPARWDYDVGGHGWGNRELQFYTKDRRENARVENGRLVIEARRESWETSEFTSARLVTRGRQAWKEGRFEIRARVPAGRGTWPAIWMLPVEWKLGSGKWPDVGEIDIMEHVGHDAGTVHASAHSKDYQWQIGTQKTGTIKLPGVTTAFHVYVLEWTAEELRALVDEQLFFSYRNEGKGWSAWPYDQEFYLILNVAVGGAWGAAKGIDHDAFPQRLEVDYVRVYQPQER
jgi:beta-glucanase (GH16 family)